MNFQERPASQRWEAMTFRGQPMAEVWFKPEGESGVVKFRIPRASFQIPGLGQHLTAANLLKTVGITQEEVDSCRQQVTGLTGENNTDLNQPLTPPPGEDAHLILHACVKMPPQEIPHQDPHTTQVPSDHTESVWQELQARWNKILGLEASMETVRISLESLRAEMETSAARSLSGDDKIYALNADVAQWTKAKSRVRFALPKAREFIHRANWVVGAPERKKLYELFKNTELPPSSNLPLGAIAEELDGLLKNRQVLNSHGVSVLQECKGVVAEVQSALKALQRNAAAKAIKLRAAALARGRSR